MSLEFTGERVIPGQVEINLWNEHVARYAFAARLGHQRRVLDAGCGTGYGAAELATVAASVTALDLSADALSFGLNRYPTGRIRWIQGSCDCLPFPKATFDLVVAFEVIEHLENWPALLKEARRVLTPDGQFVVSTPNIIRYAEDRASSGPNPFHVHEFEFEEFRDALAAYFPDVSLFLEDHVEGVVFHSVRTPGKSEVRVDEPHIAPDESSFFVAVCGPSPQTHSPGFVYLPPAADLLRERQAHIAKLQNELALKDAWLRSLQDDHARLHDLHRHQTRDLEARTAWGEALDAQLKAASEEIAAMQERHTSEVKAVAAGYQQKVTELEEENRRALDWGHETERHLTAELESARAELSRCLDALHEAEATLEERTEWALNLDRQREEMNERIRRSRWMRLGRAFHLGPEIR